MNVDEASDDATAWLWPQPGQDLLTDQGHWSQIACVGWLKDDWYGHAHAFRRSAEILHQQASQDTCELDTAFFPMAFLWRHYVELTLKRLITDLQHLLNEPSQEVMRTHNIEVLWRVFRPLAERAHPNEPSTDLDNVEATLRQLHGLDPTSEGFRYPIRANGSPTLEGIDRIHLGTFHDAMVRTANWLDSGVDLVDEELQMKAEYDREMSAEQDWY
ncbi:hypothetical protein ABZ915_30810 [Streptomyces sp. NPDC046915]|uniref:hypothetical protein n=1 Tax=Streptomyces sp. NPDC046915 TaxID=3155257 RepID=UPI003403FC86